MEKKQEAKSFKIRFSKGLVVAGSLAIGVGIWDIAVGGKTAGIVLVVLGSIILATQFYCLLGKKS